MPRFPEALTLTVLGSSAAVPRPGRACSAYLLQGAGSCVVMDLGSGALANLRLHVAPEDLDAVLISHMHPDHFLDVITLRYALRYGERSHARRPTLFLPPDGDRVVRRIAAAIGDAVAEEFLDEYEVRCYDPAGGFAVGELRMSFAPATHYIPSFAMRCDVGDRSITYSSDTAPDERVSALAHDTDAFICEATLLGSEEDQHPRGHSSAAEAGAMAHAARARRLVLTHYRAERTAEDLREEARHSYDGQVLVADDHMQLAV